MMIVHRCQDPAPASLELGSSRAIRKENMGVSMYESKRCPWHLRAFRQPSPLRRGADTLRQEAYRPGKSEQRNPFVKLDAARSRLDLEQIRASIMRRAVIAIRILLAFSPFWAIATDDRPAPPAVA
jgi:hypothetical protein